MIVTVNNCKNIGQPKNYGTPSGNNVIQIKADLNKLGNHINRNASINISTEVNSKAPEKAEDVMRKPSRLSVAGKLRKSVTFKDQVTTNKLVDIVNVESYKVFNVIEEEVNLDNRKNSCCIIS